MYDANDFSEVDWYPSELRIGVSPEGKISERMALLGGSSQFISGYKPPFISDLCHLDGVPQPYLGDLQSPWLLTTCPSWDDPPSQGGTTKTPVKRKLLLALGVARFCPQKIAGCDYSDFFVMFIFRILPWQII